MDLVWYVPSRITELCTYSVALAHKFQRFDLFVTMQQIWRDSLISNLKVSTRNKVQQFYDVAVKAENDFQLYLEDSYPEKGM